MATRILFGQRERTLVYDIGAMVAMERAMDGKPTGEIIRSLGNWSFSALIVVLWAGLKHEDPKLSQALTQKHLEHYVDLPGANIKQLRKDITDAIEGSSWYKQIDADDEPEASGDGDEPNPTR